MAVADNRGSVGQHYLFDLCLKLYPANKVDWELVIPDTGQRFDIFLVDYGIAIEFDGLQHFQYVQHFHKDDAGYIDSIKKDRIKTEWAEANGVVIIRFNDSNLPKDHIELRDIINRNLKETDYTYAIFDKPKDTMLDLAKQYRKEMYLKNKKKNDKYA